MTDAARALDQWVRPIDDWPAPGVTFRDITPLLGRAHEFRVVIDALAERVSDAAPVDVVVGIEARGFIVGTAVAQRLGVGFVPVRKEGKLPAEVVSTSYDLEYGSATIEMHADAIASGARVAIVDDVLATGGTLMAAAELVRRVGGDVVSAAVLIEISGLGGVARLDPLTCVSLASY